MKHLLLTSPVRAQIGDWIENTYMSIDKLEKNTYIHTTNRLVIQLPFTTYSTIINAPTEYRFVSICVFASDTSGNQAATFPVSH